MTNHTPRARSTNLARPRPDPGGADRVSGIDKGPVASISVFAPGPDYGDGSGVAGDVVGDSQHHGGADKAVYAYAREELDYWAGRLDKTLLDGQFGENLTTEGITWADVQINQRFRVGEALLEVSVPRTPCRTFAGWVGEPGWMKTFIARGDAGAYLRVVEPGVIRAGDLLEPVSDPGHGITMGQAAAAKLGDKELTRRVVEANVLPPLLHDRLAARL